MAYFAEKFRGIFQVRDTPHRIALAFAIGVLWGFSPLLGLHTIGAFFTAWLFGFNRLVAFAGVCVGNPWTLFPVYTFCIWLGARLSGINHVLPEINWDDMSLINMIKELGYLVKPFIIGSTIISVFLGLISYFIIHYLVTKYKKRTECPIS